MPHQLITFDDVALPMAMAEDDLGSGRVDSTLVDSVGGAYNYWGDTTRYPRKISFSQRGLYRADSGDNFRIIDTGDFRIVSGGNFRIIGGTPRDILRDQVDTLKAKVGQWGQVWRKSYNDGQLTYKMARLINVNHREDVNKAGVVAELESTFETLDVGWRAQTASTAGAAIAAGSSAPVNAYVGGQFPIFDAILRVTASGGTVTTVTVIGAGIALTWTGVLSAGATLTIDGGRQLVTVGAADAYTGLTFGGGHTSDQWLPLALGNNTLTVGAVGAAANAVLEYSDRWP